MKATKQIVDTFPSFLRAFEIEQPAATDDWLKLWVERYMALWPELLAMQVADYAEQGEDWRQVAREMVFPGMNEKVPALERTHRELPSIIEMVEFQAQQQLGFDGPVTYVLYVGIGNGAGWLTTYDGRPAVLFGLEGIVDSGFEGHEKLAGLVAHELGHVVHFHWREKGGRQLGNGPWWQLYEEGFAQYCEGRILGRVSWHMRESSAGEDWLIWCQENRVWLAAEFQRVVDDGESIRPFFGSWHDLRVRKQTGYYLGHEIISQLAQTTSLRDIALLAEGPALEARLRPILQEFAASSA